jgi:tetratricopeptide (TPR) repeat protein
MRFSREASRGEARQRGKFRAARQGNGIAGEGVSVVGMPPHSPIVLSGNVPPLAEPHFARHETDPDLISRLRPGQVIALTDAEPTSAAPAGQGGTGKTQLAVEFAHAVWNAGATEALVWVTGSSREAILAGFAQAAQVVGAAGPAADLATNSGEVAAGHFVTWLASTRRSWLLIIDDLGQVTDLDGLWPGGPAGQVVITTRLPAAKIGRDARIIPVTGFSRRESLEYLNGRLNAYPDQRIEALDLAEDLNGLPLALAQAAAVMLTRDQDCRQYRALFAERRNHMTGTPVGGVSAAVLATWSIACECAHELAPSGLAWPALALAAMLDEYGIPGEALTSPAACAYITGHPSTAGGADQNIVRRAIGNLAKADLVTIDPATAVRTVRMHPSARTAVRAFIPQAELEQVILAAADALVETWTEDGGAELDQAMRDCTAALCEVDSGPLWKPEAHPVLFRAGMSFDGSGLADAAIAYWHAMVATSTRLLGPAHADAVTARDRLAASYESAGRTGDAIVVFASALTDRERNLGQDHPDTIAARGRLGHAYASAGRPEAVATYERTVADSDRVLGPGHPGTLSARSALSDAYLEAGRSKDAIVCCQMLVTDAERLLGATDATAIAARNSLAEAFAAASQSKDAIEQYKRVLAAQEATLGRDHPDAVTARANLASALRRAGKTKDAIEQYARVLTDRERLTGPDNLDTIAARASLAFGYRTAGQLREAIRAYEQALAARERVQGPDHKDTRIARTQLAATCQQAGRLTDAIAHYERALADAERVQGPSDIEALTDRCSLAATLFAAGRLLEAVTMLQQAKADCERNLGPDHPLTRTVRENLRAATTT